MSRTSYTQFRNSNNSLFTVSGALAGYKHAADKYMADGIIQVDLVSLCITPASYVKIFNFPYKFKIMRASWLHHVGGGRKAGNNLNIYKNGTTATTGSIVSVSLSVGAASRTYNVDNVLNFNNVDIDTTDYLRIVASGVGAASANADKGTLTLFIRPV